MLEIQYVPSLVAASVAVAIMASFTSLRLTSGLAALDTHHRKVRICKAAFALGGGIWSMHFVAMLSINVSIPIFYDPLRTMGSALIAILLTGSALMSLHFGVRTRLRIVFAGVVTGIGIVSMHYLGMSAISGNCIVNYDPGGVLLAIGIAIASCILAMELAYRKRSTFATICGSVTLGLSISAMHYSAVTFTTFSISDNVTITATQAISSDHLAMIVAFAAFVICGLFLLMTVPNEPASDSARKLVSLRGATTGSVGIGSVATGSVATVEASQAEKVATSRIQTINDEAVAEPVADNQTVRIPYEQNKTLRFLSTDAIYFVQADGHYTWVTNAGGQYFCPWSISRVEKCLEAQNFIRTHRSYLVNRDHISGFRRNGDRAVCIVGTGVGTEIPVSRGRISEFQALFNL